MIFYFAITSLWAEYTYTNTLINENSPYLQQHAHNPVNWYPWGEEAFEKARKENKPIFLSIGYSTCHWCHVMEEESFEDLEVAKLLNRDYVAIKVDKEEYPQIDKKYQRFYKKFTGKSGGWPLTVLMTPEKKPFFIASYLPKEAGYGSKGLLELLPRYGRLYRQDPSKILRSTKGIGGERDVDQIHPLPPVDRVISNVILQLRKQYDPDHGGFSKRPKFPEASRLSLLLAIYRMNGDREALKMAEFTLKKMAQGGIYDQVEGGFFRYTPDQAWQVPHFEKMLYTNAELIPLYVSLYRISKNPLYKRIVEETIDEMDRHYMEEGLYFGASDADSSGEEGAYFLYDYLQLGEYLAKRGWKKREIEITLAYFGIEEDGNFDGELSQAHLSDGAAPPRSEELKSILAELRKARQFPFVDRKVISSWNAMMIKALFAASVIDESYREKGKRYLERLLSKMSDANMLYHQVLFGKYPKQPGLLDDYAFVVDALLAAYEATYEDRYLARAEDFAQKAITLFHREGKWYLDNGETDTLADSDDSHYRSALSVMLSGLLTLAALEEETAYAAVVKESLRNYGRILASKPADAPTLTEVYLREEKGEIIIKSDRNSLLHLHAELDSIDYPFLVTKAAKVQGWMACGIGSCFAEGKSLEELAEKLEKRKAAETKKKQWR